MYNILRLQLITSLESPLSFYYDNLPVELLPSYSLTPFLLSGFIITHKFRFVKYFFSKKFNFFNNFYAN